jgi:hypothetical protein
MKHFFFSFTPSRSEIASWTLRVRRPCWAVAVVRRSSRKEIPLSRGHLRIRENKTHKVNNEHSSAIFLYNVGEKYKTSSRRPTCFQSVNNELRKVCKGAPLMGRKPCIYDSPNKKKKKRNYSPDTRNLTLK